MMKCKLCDQEVIIAKWYDYLPFFPFAILGIIIWKNTYRHKDNLFQDNPYCEAVLMSLKNIK